MDKKNARILTKMAGVERDSIRINRSWESTVGGRKVVLSVLNCLLLTVEYNILCMISSDFGENFWFLCDFSYIFPTILRFFAVFRIYYGFIRREFAINRKFPIKNKQNIV